MPSHSTPGVYIEEVPGLPPSVVPVATAVPVFIGYTQTALDSRGQDLTRKSVRINSVREYEACFGTSPVQDMKFKLIQHVGAGNELLGGEVIWHDKPTVPTHLLHYAIQLYFANGGGPCCVYSVGNQEATPATTDFTDAISALEAEDEPTLLVFPDAVKLAPDSEYGAVVDAALKSCNKTRNRFTLIDVPNAVPGKTDANDREWRHINARRFTSFIEASVRKALGVFVFEPNVASTWARAQTMIANFLSELWRNGALMGDRPEQAFGVEIGLGKTMSAEDVLDGRMIVVVHLALFRPAEFMVLSFMQKMAEA